MEKSQMKIITNTKMAGGASSGQQKTIINNWLMMLMNALVDSETFSNEAICTIGGGHKITI